VSIATLVENKKQFDTNLFMMQITIPLKNWLNVLQLLLGAKIQNCLNKKHGVTTNAYSDALRQIILFRNSVLLFV